MTAVKVKVPAPCLVTLPDPRMTLPLTVVSPLPSTVRFSFDPPAVSLTEPETVSRLLLLFVQVWLDPRMTFAEMVFAPEPEATVMPLAPLIVRLLVPEPEAMMEPAVLAVPVPVKVRLLIEVFWFRFVVAEKFVGVSAVMKTFVPGPGTVATVVPAAEVHQLVFRPETSVQLFDPRLPLQ